MTYPHYIDLATGKTLVCEPGKSYDIMPGALAAPVPTDGRFAEKKNNVPRAPKNIKGRLPAQVTNTPER